MLGQLLGDECWKVHEPPAMCLRLAKDEAITQARAAADQMGTSGARRQVAELEEKRHQRGGVAQQNWTVANADLLQTYSAVTDDLDHGVDARTVGYHLARPADVLEALIHHDYPLLPTPTIHSHNDMERPCPSREGEAASSRHPVPGTFLDHYRNSRAISNSASVQSISRSLSKACSLINFGYTQTF